MKYFNWIAIFFLLCLCTFVTIFGVDLACTNMNDAYRLSAKNSNPSCMTQIPPLVEFEKGEPYTYRIGFMGNNVEVNAHMIFDIMDRVKAY